MQPDSGRVLTQVEAIHEAIDTSMDLDDRVIIIGEGVPDPRGIFGTTSGLRQKYGADRVFDMPLSENGMTGICIGAALSGMRPILVHQRIEFSLLSMDQLINNAAKWNYMFAGQNTVPMVVRMIIGRGWGQGPQHSQSLQTLFAHIPGLKVVMPTSAYDAKGLLISAIEDNNPVIFIEHRWLHSISGVVPEGKYTVPLGKAKLLKPGTDVTIAAFSYMVMEAMQAATELSSHGIEAEVIDMRSVRPLDIDSVLTSVKKTGRLLVADTGHLTNSIASELITCVVESEFNALKTAPIRIASPDYPVPTSHYAASDYYPEAVDIADSILRMFGDTVQVDTDTVLANLKRTIAKDIPNPEFRGPF